MPFLGKDWRSDGELWVKTDRGWETLKNWRVKIHENINHHVLQRLLQQSIHQPEKRDQLIECSPRALYIHVPRVVCSSISQGQSEVLFGQVCSTLDMEGAFKDLKRLSYVFKVMEVLVDEYLTKLSGCIQIQLFSLLHSALDTVLKTGQNKQALVSLLEKLVISLRENRYTFYHIGSEFLWTRHCKEAQRMLDTAKNTDVCQASPSENVSISDMPFDILRRILLCLGSQEDLINAGKASHIMHSVVNDNSLWRTLCLHHFSREQLGPFMQLAYKEEQGNGSINTSWYKIYIKLHKRYGIKESYPDCVCWCEGCHMMFWKMTSHPCKLHTNSPKGVQELSPRLFIEMFNV